MFNVLATTIFGANSSVQSTSAGGLGVVDWSIIAIYAGATIGLGWYYSRRQQRTEEHFVGDRRMNPILIGISLFVTLMSTVLTYPCPARS